MSEKPLVKGDRVHVRRLGKADVTGKIYWVGPSKYGPGLRFGVKADDGSKHWCDEEDVERVDGGPKEGPGGLKKGSTVRVTAGEHEGVEGEVFFYSKGRVGVRDDHEEMYWVNEGEVKVL
ncbi:MAG: hypothetical protein CMN31_09325 [Sandaracinus sp.]|nr:hypothetical protein [Myxococcales bacterium]MAT29973.1 hypothetical protein [Sandaracinus sp.]MBJ71527.1 hypothetical protein [Sandaracinus sp.]